MEEITEATLRRYRNLKLYKGKTDDEIREMISQKKAPVIKSNKSDANYDRKFQEKLDMLHAEFGLDMNTSNDRDTVSNYVKQLLQADSVDEDIKSILGRPDKNKEDIMTLKALGDFQRDVQITIADLQDKLGISRKVRKEKSVDDIPQFIDGLLSKAVNFWEKKTIAVDCPKCQIELVRYWLNFPDTTTLASFTVQCPHCYETVTYNG
jgi:hypothetical protein